MCHFTKTEIDLNTLSWKDEPNNKCWDENQIVK